MCIKMRKILGFVCVCLLMGILSTNLTCSNAFAATENASGFIAFYSQTKGATWNKSKGIYDLGYWDKEMAKRGIYINKNGGHPGIVNDGCNLLSYVHIVQYLTNKCSSIDTQLDLLEVWARLTDRPDLGDATYDNYMINHYGNQGIARYDLKRLTSFSAFQVFFDNGGAAHINIPGHFFIVIGAIEKDGKQYLLAVDSSYDSTIRRLKSHTAYQVGSFSKIVCPDGTYPSDTGTAKQYWIEYNDFKSSGCTVRHAYTSSARVGGIKVEAISISTPEGAANADLEYIGYNDSNTHVVLHAYTAPIEAQNPEIEWSISNPNVLRKDSSQLYDGGLTVGHFTIIGVGKTNVTAAAKDGSGVSQTILFGYSIAKLSMPTSNVSLSVGDTWQACPVMEPSFAKNSDLIWTSSNSQIAKVDENGKVTAVASGSATITAWPKYSKEMNELDPVTCTINVANAPILAFNSINYPDPYKISTSGYIWGDNSGTITSRDGLASVTFNIYDTNGNRVANYTNTQNVKTLTMKSITEKIKMSALKVAGLSEFEIIATDVNGHVLEASLKFTASTSQSTKTGSFSRTYTSPTLLTSKSYENSDYYLYRSSYTWEQARQYAQALGGYLATVNDAGENAAILEMLTTKQINYAYIGGYYNGTEYVWVTGENMDYKNWVPGQPDHSASRENYMEMFGAKMSSEVQIGQWNDIENASYPRNYFVVEIPKYESFGDCGENATWSFGNNKLTISGNGAMYDYDSFRDTPWTGYREDIYEIDIKNGITSIGHNAFDEFVNMQSAVIIPDSVTSIGNYAFSSCEVRIPNSVVQIGLISEVGCYFVVDKNNPNYSSLDGTLYNKNKTELIKCNPWASDITIPNSVTSICDSAFAYCNNLTSITIPNTVAAIQDYTFESCYSLTTVTIPNSVKSIGNGAFWFCPHLREIVIPSSVESIGWDAFYHYPGFVIHCYDGSAAHTYAVQNGFDYVLFDTPLNNADFILPPGIRSIKAEAFYGLAAKRVKLSENITSIGSKAFAYSPNMVGIYIPSGCTSIASDAFIGIPGLTIFSQGGSYAEQYAYNNGFMFVNVD